MPLEVGFSTLGLWLKDPTLQVHFCLEKNRERLPLGARWSSEAQEAEDPPSFYTSSKVRIKTLPAGMSVRGLRFSVLIIAWFIRGNRSHLL